MNHKIVLLSFLLAFLCHPAHSLIIYVNANVQGGNQDGTSWADAFPILNSAIIAAQYGDTIWVAQGVYRPTTGTNRNISFLLKNGIRLFGGFDGTESSLDERDWETQLSILSGDIGISGDSTDNSYNVVYCNFADSTTMLDGFVITGGNADNNASGPTTVRPKSGGGMYIAGSSSLEDTRPLITNCKFTGNYARYHGGGMFVRTVSDAGASPMLFNCEFQLNTSASEGGGLYKEGGSVMHEMFIENCSFIKNVADAGGGLFFSNTNGNKNVHVLGCGFFDNYNSALIGGGGIYHEIQNGESILEITKCIFQKNFSIAEGSTIYNIFSVYSTVKIDSCIFILNNTHVGGTIFTLQNGSTEISNSSFVANSAINPSGSVSTGGCILLAGGDVTFENCLFEKNSAEKGSVYYKYTHPLNLESSSCTFFSNESLTGLMDCSGNTTFTFTISNSLFSKNSLTQNSKLINCTGNNLVISHSLVDVPGCSSIASGNVTCGSGMIYNADPLFADTAAGDFRLLPCSPARNAGSNAIVDSLGILTDIEGNPRIRGGTVDMGAYESPAFSIASHTVASAPCAGSPGSITFDLSHGCPPFLVQWQGGSASADTTPFKLEAPAGSYSLTVTDAYGEMDTLQAVVSEPPALSAQATAEAFACGVNTGGEASVAVQGGTPPIAWLWSDANGNILGDEAALENLPVGSYIVIANDSNGCVISDTVVVEAQGNLGLSISVTPIHCHDSSDGTAAIQPVSGAAPISWLWESGQTDSLLTGLSGGSYSVTVTDALGCTGDLQFSMQAPTELQAAANSTDVACFGAADGSASAEAGGGSPPYQFLWSNQQTDSLAVNLAPGWHTVTVTDKFGCTDTAAVLIGSPEQLLAGIEAPEVICFGEPAPTLAALAAGGTPPYTFLWNTGATDSLLANASAGSFQLTVTDANQCSQQANVTIDSSHLQILFEIQPATGAAASDGAVNVDLIFGGASPFTFLWSNGAMTQSLENVPPGDYSLTVTDTDSCQQVFYFTVDIESAVQQGASAEFSALVMPNPSGQGSQARLQVQASRALFLTAKLMDVLGKQLWHSTFSLEPGRTEQLLPGELLPGVYWLLLTNELGEQLTLKVAVVE